MSAKIIDGKALAGEINLETRRQAAELAATGRAPALAVVLVGDDPASQLYVNSKVKKCGELGIRSFRKVLSADATQDQVLALIAELNADAEVDGILVQSPPPPQIDEGAVIAAIDPDKDVDCFCAANVGRMLIGERDGFLPCTPNGVMEILKRCRVATSGAHAVVIGRSNIVGKPLVALLLQKTAGANCTVSCVHSATRNLPEIVRTGDIVIAAIGRPEFVTADMIKPGAVVIDVGINRVSDPASPKGYRVVGDVKFDEVSEIASMITPVPGGVGPMTIAMLMHNTVLAAQRLLKRT